MGIPFVIMIAHRMETVLSADRIVKLQKGKIVAEGSYEKLVEEGHIEKIEVDEENDNMVASMHEQSLIKKEKEKENVLKII